MDKLVREGKFEEAYLGIYGVDVNEQTAAQYNMPTGVYVSQVVTGSGAAESGVKKGDVITGIDDLRQHLVVEHKIIGIAHERDFFEHLMRKGAVSRMVLRQFLPGHDILEPGEAAVEKVFVARHPTLQGAVAENARPQHHGIQPVDNHIRNRLNQLRSVLIIRV